MRRARTDSSCVPAGGLRRRRHQRSNLAAAHVPAKTRDLYRRLIERLSPTFDRGALVVLLALADLQQAGDTLNDVVITQDQLVELLAGDDDPRWGLGIYSVRRHLAWLTDNGWLSIEDVRLPEPGWQINSYRFLIPASARPLWNTLSQQAEGARLRGRQRFQDSQANARRPQPASQAPTTPPGPAQRPSGADDPDPPAGTTPRRHDGDGVRRSREQLAARLRNRAGP